jgi:hypothetical protein
MHFDEARRILSAEQKEHPQNLLPVYLADYEDCIVLLLNSDPAEYKRRVAHFDERLTKLGEGDRNSPWYRFCKAGIYLHWAIVNIRFGEQYSAAMNFRRSFALLKENSELFPSWEYNAVFSGLQQAVVGSVPPSYKWLTSLLGMKGSVRRGAATLQNFIEKHNITDPMYNETVLYNIYVRFYLVNEQKEVWNFLNSSEFSTADNLLNAYVKVNIALDYRKTDEAIQVLNSVSGDDGYNDYPLFYYQMGVGLLSRCDTLSATYFSRYLAKSKSGQYIKDSWQKMAYAWYINNNMQKANYCLAQCKTQGEARIDGDKQAARFAEKGIWPQRTLLQARLLIDGGYNDKALQVLNSINVAALTDPGDRAEYYFRMGRVYEELAESASRYYKMALDNYRTAINIGKERHEQFAARAALHMGKVYEKLGLAKEALAMYNECLDMPSHDFQNSIDQQAKAGINRVEGGGVN